MWDKPGRLNWFWRSRCEGLSSFNPKRFYYSCADLAVHFKEELPFTRENSADSYLCSRLTLPHSVSYFFFFSFSLGVFYSVSSNTDQVLSINLSANKFVFGEFNVHHKDWLTNSGGTVRLGELCYSFSISNNLTQMANFPTRIPDWLSKSCSFEFIYFFWC